MSIDSARSIFSTTSNVTPDTDSEIKVQLLIRLMRCVWSVGVNVLFEPVKQLIVKKKILHKDHKVEVRVLTPCELLPEDDRSLAVNKATDVNTKLELHCGLHGSILYRLSSDHHLISPIVMVRSRASRSLMIRVNIPHALTTIGKAHNNEVQLFAYSPLGILSALEPNLYTLDEKTCTVTMGISGNGQQIFLLSVIGTLRTQFQSSPRINGPLAIRCIYYVLMLSDPSSSEIHVKVFCAIDLPTTWKVR